MARITKKALKALPDFDKRIVIGEKWCDCYLVHVPVTTHYNGSPLVYVDPPVKPPSGYKFQDIHVGLELNCKPALATYYLKPVV